MPEMTTVLSSHVWQIGYDPDQKLLAVRYAPTVKHPAGRVVEYVGVPSDIATEVLSAPSIGGAMHTLIKGKYEFGG